MNFFVLAISIVICTFSLVPPVRAADVPLSPLPTAILPDGLGVNIHFTDPRPGEMKMLADAGFRWIRMDFHWGSIEKVRGAYDFSAYDRLLAALAPYHIRALFILDYANDLYDGGLAPHTEDGRAAFARWAAAAVQHFAGHGILWELWNEPNGGFWKPKANVEDYSALGLAVGKALRKAAPGEIYIGPAAAGMDFAFLESCFKAGLLEYWSAVSVHPYRQSDPETASEEYRRLRLLIRKYAPAGKQIPILSGEWGYSTAWGGFDLARQAKYLPREWLTNVMNDVLLSIWYDWHDDGLDPKDPEHHFGTVKNEFHAGADPVYDAKPSYLACRTASRFLDGFRFSKRLWLGREDDYALLFSRANEVCLAAWTTARDPHAAVIPASPGTFTSLNLTGDRKDTLTADARGLSLTLDSSPCYLTPDAPNDLLRVAAAWDRAPLEVVVEAPTDASVKLSLRNPLKSQLSMSTSSSTPTSSSSTSASTSPGGVLSATLSRRVSRSAVQEPLLISWTFKGLGTVVQQSRVIISNPLRLYLLPLVGDHLSARVENPSGTSFKGTLRARVDLGAGEKTVVVPVNLAGTEVILPIPVAGSASGSYTASAELRDDGGRVLIQVPSQKFQLLDDFSRYPLHEDPAGWQVVADGDSKVASVLKLTADVPPEGPAVPGGGALKLDYRFDAGWKFARVSPRLRELQALPGAPLALGLWVYGDGTGNSPRMRFAGSDGQTFQPSSPAVSWKGWKYISFNLDGFDSGHWGGPDDGVVRYPLRLDSLFLIDNAHAEATSGTIYLAQPTLVFK